jgi:ATP-binding cassette, subfamily C, bacterial exporter for protease/lipase
MVTTPLTVRPAQRMLRQAAYGIGLIALLSGAVNLLILVSPIYMLQVFDRVLLTYRVETLLYLTLIAAVCVLVLGVFDGLRGIAAARLGRWWDDTVRPDLLDAALAAARTRGPNVGAGLHDLQQVRNFVGAPAMTPFFDAPWTPVFIAVTFLLHPLLGLVALGSALALLCLAVANDLASRAALAGSAAPRAANGLLAAAALRNADVVHAMGMQAAVVGLHGARQLAINAAHQASAERTALITGISKALRIGVQIAVLGLGAWLVTLGELTAGGMIAASIILGRALAPIEQGIGSWRSFIAAREAHARIKALLEAVPARAEPTALPAPLGRLAVEGMSFVLPGQDKPVLRQVSFALEPGSVMAVVGPSTAGKSTLCRLLVGSWQPSAGHVRLDGADLSQWRSEDRARYVGYLPQAVELFGGTVRQNIARFADVPDEMVVEAARRANCHEMILRLAHGYDTEIGEGGAFLSGGQRQRIGLARALLGEPRLLVLDEPNANLDQEGESALIAAITEVKQRGATVILVSHRFAMMRVVDLVGVLRAGALEKFGPRDQMLQDLQAVPRESGVSVAGLALNREARA